MKKKNIIIGIVLGILAIFLIFEINAVARMISKPQAPTLNLVRATKAVETASPTITSTVELTPTSQIIAEAVKPETPTAAPLAATQVPPTKAPAVCGQTGTWTILALGHSTRIEHEGTQFIRLVKVDFDHKSVLVYTVPPHLVLDTPSLVKDYSISTSSLEEVYSRVVKKVGESKDADFKGTQALAQVLLDTFGVPIKHYMTIQDDFVVEAVDALGGIYVRLPEDFTMPAESSRPGEVIKAGIQLLDGEMIHEYVSAVAMGEDEYDRLTRQNAVLEGMRKKMVDPATLLKVFDLYSVYKKYVVTDLSLEQMTSLGCLARLVPRDQIVMQEPQADDVLTAADGAMQFKDLEAEARKVQSLFGVP